MAEKGGSHPLAGEAGRHPLAGEAGRHPFLGEGGSYQAVVWGIQEGQIGGYMG